MSYRKVKTGQFLIGVIKNRGKMPQYVYISIKQLELLLLKLLFKKENIERLRKSL